MFEFLAIEGKPDQSTLPQIKAFYAALFESAEFAEFERRISEVENLLTILAFHRKKIIGFKLGYRLTPKKFYSWLGGVDNRFRRRGIAGELMKRQHNLCKCKNYEIVLTKTKNSFKPMLILNIKNGFDIVEVYRDQQKELKIVMEKHLI